jgi:hypothetical protein
LAGRPDIFGNGRQQIRQQAAAEKDELYKQISQLKVALGFRSTPSTPSPGRKSLSATRDSEVLQLRPSG